MARLTNDELHRVISTGLRQVENDSDYAKTDRVKTFTGRASQGYNCTIDEQKTLCVPMMYWENTLLMKLRLQSVRPGGERRMTTLFSEGKVAPKLLLCMGTELGIFIDRADLLLNGFKAHPTSTRVDKFGNVDIYIHAGHVVALDSAKPYGAVADAAFDTEGLEQLDNSWLTEVATLETATQAYNHGLEYDF